MGCAGWADSDGPFLAGQGHAPSPLSTKQQVNHGLGETASWGGFSYCKPGGQAGCSDEKSVWLDGEDRKCGLSLLLPPQPLHAQQDFQSQGSPVWAAEPGWNLSVQRETKSRWSRRPRPRPAAPRAANLSPALPQPFGTGSRERLPRAECHLGPSAPFPCK